MYVYIHMYRKLCRQIDRYVNYETVYARVSACVADISCVLPLCVPAHFSLGAQGGVSYLNSLSTNCDLTSEKSPI